MTTKLLIFLSLFFLTTPTMYGSQFFDDFEDNDISDWQSLCVPGYWSVSNGMVHGYTNSSPSFLTPVNAFSFEDGVVTVSVTGTHAFGISARVDSNETGIYAYVSPDANVARIRLASNGSQSTILNSLYASFPSGVMYELTLTSEGENLCLTIEVPSTDQTWILNAIDPNPHSGVFGFHMGDEAGASWDWIQAECSGNTELTWLTTNDESYGDGDFAFEPGETIDLQLELTNNDSQSLTNSFGILQSLNSEIAVIESNVNYGTITPGESSFGSSSFMVLAPLVTPEDEVYNMRLTVMADGGYQEQFVFGLPVGNGLVCDVESGAPDWNYEILSGGWENDWHVSSETNYTPSGQFSFKCGDSEDGDYSNHHFSALTSPFINLPLASEINFWMQMDAQTSDMPEALDGGIIQYGRCGNWIDLSPVSGYSHQIASGTTGPFDAGTEVFSGISPWTEYSISLPDSLAGPGTIRFVFGSDENGTREGWYIDDISMGIPSSNQEETNLHMSTKASLQVTQNPFRESVSFIYNLSGNAVSSLDIYDLSGRQVAEFAAVGGTELQTILWNGSDNNGHQVPPGVYLARLHELNGTTVKLIRL